MIHFSLHPLRQTRVICEMHQCTDYTLDSAQWTMDTGHCTEQAGCSSNGLEELLAELGILVIACVVVEACFLQGVGQNRFVVPVTDLVVILVVFLVRVAC